MNKLYWTGIGSRKSINDNIMSQQKGIGFTMSKKGWTLVTGGAGGSDYNFLAGASKGCDKNLPVVVRPIRYKNYTGKNKFQSVVEMMENSDYEAARTYFIKNDIFTELQFDGMSIISKVLHARNYYQIFDWNGNVRSKFVVYHAPENSWNVVSGGTRTAIAIARLEKVPVFNLRLKGHYNALQELIEGLPNV